MSNLVRINSINPASPDRARPVSFNTVEFTMTEREAPRGNLLDLLFSITGVFPAPLLEALIARMEVGK